MWIRGYWRSFKMVLFESMGTVSYSPSIVTMAVSLTISEIFSVKEWSGCSGGLGLGVGLAGCRFLCAGKYLAVLIECEWSGPQHPAQGNVTFPEILFMTWRAQGVMNGWLLVFLSRMCCRKASCAVVRLVAFQCVRRKPCMLPPVGGNFWPCF